MATATADRLEDTAAGDDYGQALGEGEITRLLKTVQAAQFKKSETFVADDTAFKPRSLVEIAFAAEQKRQQEEQAARAAEQAAAAAALKLRVQPTRPPVWLTCPLLKGRARTLRHNSKYRNRPRRVRQQVCQIICQIMQRIRHRPARSRLKKKRVK